jgi:hypothetical protein
MPIADLLIDAAAGHQIISFMDGQFLGFMVHQRGIEISRKSIDAINKVVAPANKTKLQSLIGICMGS